MTHVPLFALLKYLFTMINLSLKSLKYQKMSLPARIFCQDNKLSVVPWAHTNYKMFPWTRSNWVRQDRERRLFNIFSVTFLWAVSFQFSLVAVCGFLQFCSVEYVGCIAMRSTGHRPHLSAGWSVQRCVQPYGRAQTIMRRVYLSTVFYLCTA